MFLPIGDTPNPRSTPYANYLLIALNLAVFLFVSLPLTQSRPDFSDPRLMEYLQAVGVRGQIPVRAALQHLSAYDLFLFEFGFRPSDPSLLTLFTSMFLHGGWLHLGGNTLFLWIFGDNVEARLGHFSYILVYFATGIAATLFFSFFVPGSPIPLVGASGAISGVLGCYFLWFPQNQVKTFIFLFPFLMTTFLIPARLVLGIYLFLDNLLPFLLGGANTEVAHGAHIGGFLAGLAVAWGRDRLWKQKLRRRGVGQKGSSSSRNELSRSLRQGRPAEAARQYLSLSEGLRRGLPTGDLLAVGRFFLEQREFQRALSLFRRIIAERPNDPQLDEAYLGAGMAAMQIPRGGAAANQYFLSALDVAGSEGLSDDVRAYLTKLNRSRGGSGSVPQGDSGPPAGP